MRGAAVPWYRLAVVSVILVALVYDVIAWRQSRKARKNASVN